jgi:hypothetical protein
VSRKTRDGQTASRESRVDSEPTANSQEPTANSQEPTAKQNRPAGTGRRCGYAWQDSNLRPLGPQPNALSPELQARSVKCTRTPGTIAAGREGFEPSEDVYGPQPLSRRPHSTTLAPPQTDPIHPPKRRAAVPEMDSDPDRQVYPGPAAPHKRLAAIPSASSRDTCRCLARGPEVGTRHAVSGCGGRSFPTGTRVRRGRTRHAVSLPQRRCPRKSAEPALMHGKASNAASDCPRRGGPVAA